MFTKGIFDADRLHKGFAVVTKIDCIENIKVEVIDGFLTLTCGDWNSYNLLRDKLNQVTASMRSVLVREGMPRWKYKNIREGCSHTLDENTKEKIENLMENTEEKSNET